MKKNQNILMVIIFGVFILVACSPSNSPKYSTSVDSENGKIPTATPGTMSSSSGSSHMMEPIGGESIQKAIETNGGQLLDYYLDDEIKVFELTAKPISWPITKDISVTAWTYNDTVPGPMIRVTEGDAVRIIIKNELPEPTTIHWHGIAVPNAMDGIPNVTQKPIQPGESFVYEFVAKPAGSYMYHSHYEGDIQVSAGLYAPFIIDPKEAEVPKPDVDITLMISEWLFKDGKTWASMPMAGMEPNYFTFNGKAFPDTEIINVKKGQLVRLRLMGIGQFVHPIHLHGVPFKIVATDGHPVPIDAQLTKDTVLVSPGERYDIEFIAAETGQWMLHCHILHHTTNDNVEPGGLMLMINVTD
ncbi:MAG: copper oxidase [Chloroflexi bacterium HGW-Chloroflexi-4]|nr:MAG: copper oxidase [Chloroflexi bacterium HGW-Chloroflexi-4]